MRRSNLRRQSFLLYRLTNAKTGISNPTAEIQNPGTQDYSVGNAWLLDKVDNWLTQTKSLPFVRGGGGGVDYEDEAIQFIPNSVNAYTTVAGTAYIYDENGHLIDDGVNIYRYDYRNLLTQVRLKL